jgi:hypothetical protein
MVAIRLQTKQGQAVSELIALVLGVERKTPAKCLAINHPADAQRAPADNTPF